MWYTLDQWRGGKVSKFRYSRFDAAGRLGVSMSTIRRMIQRGELETERDEPTPNAKVWVLLDIPPDIPGGTPDTPAGDQTHVSDAPTGSPDTPPGGIPDGIPDTPPGGIPDGIPDTPPGGIPDGIPGTPPDGVPNGMPGTHPGVSDDPLSGVLGTPGGTPNVVTELALLQQQVKHLEELGAYREERLKEAEKLAQDRADRLKESEWRYHELVKQVTSTMEHVTRALPAGNGAEGKATRRSWWPFRKRSAIGS